MYGWWVNEDTDYYINIFSYWSLLVRNIFYHESYQKYVLYDPSANKMLKENISVEISSLKILSRTLWRFSCSYWGREFIFIELFRTEKAHQSGSSLITQGIENFGTDLEMFCKFITELIPRMQFTVTFKHP